MTQFNQNFRWFFLAASLPGILLMANPAFSQVRIEQVDPGTLIKPQQIETNNAGGILLDQVDPNLRKIQPRKATAAPTTGEKTKQVAIATPRQLPFIAKGVNITFSDNPARHALPVVTGKVVLN